MKLPRSESSSRARVRRACSTDVPRIATLSAQLGYPSPISEVQKRLDRILQNGDHLVLVAELDDDVVGWLHAFVKYSLDAGPRAEIGGLVVDESHRGLGLGKRLMGEAEDWARSRALEGIYLRSNVIREAAHAFYEAIGFRRIKSQHCFLKPL